MDEVNQTTYQSIGNKKMAFKNKFKSFKKGDKKELPIKGSKDAIKDRFDKEKC